MASSPQPRSGSPISRQTWGIVATATALPNRAMEASGPTGGRKKRIASGGRGNTKKCIGTEATTQAALPSSVTLLTTLCVSSKYNVCLALLGFIFLRGSNSRLSAYTRTRSLGQAPKALPPVTRGRVGTNPTCYIGTFWCCPGHRSQSSSSFLRLGR